MARDPGSVWKPLPEAGAPDGYDKTQLIFHSTGTMASAAANWAYFARANVVVESTFIVGWGPDDPSLQIMDSTDLADANGSANRRGISVEVVGDGTGPYNDWQIAECIRLGLWARAEHGILPRIIPSEPAGGFGWHVMFGAPGPWTAAVGKVCPGQARIKQLNDIVFPAIFGGAAPGGDWFDMASKQDLVDVLRAEGVSGAADWSTGQREDGSWPVGATAKQLMVEAVAEVSRSEGLSGAGDAGRLVDALAGKLPASGGSPGGALTREDIVAAVREVFGDAAA